MDDKHGLAVYERPNGKHLHQSVPSKSMMFPRAKSAMVIPPNDAMELEMDLSRMRAQTEGLSNAPFALPGGTNGVATRGGSSAGSANANDDVAQPAFSELIVDHAGPGNDVSNPLIDHGNDSVTEID